MGIDTKIRKVIGEGVANRAFYEGMPPDYIPAPGRGANKWMLLKDSLTDANYFRGLSGHNTDPSKGRMEYTFTGDEFYKEFMGDVWAALSSGHFRVVVMCVDIQEWVPSEKHAEQKKRSVARSKGPTITPVPDDARIGKHGIRTGDGPWKRFDIRACMKNRRWRANLWKYLMTRVYKSAALPVGTCIIFDYEATGPIMVQRPLKSQAMTRYRLVEHIHGYGEADRQIPYWMHQFPSLNVVLDSVDSDFLPIICHYIWTHGRKRAIVWKYYRKKACHLNLTALNLFRKWGVSSIQFLTSCVLCGTDFFDKQLVLSRIGIDAVFYGVEHARIEGDALDRLVVTDDDVSILAYEEILRHIYTVYFKAKFDASRAKVKPTWFDLPLKGTPASSARIRRLVEERKLTKSIKYPSSETIIKTHDRLMFNLVYWGVRWKDTVVNTPFRV